MGSTIAALADRVSSTWRWRVAWVLLLVGVVLATVTSTSYLLSRGVVTIGWTITAGLSWLAFLALLTLTTYLYIRGRHPRLTTTSVDAESSDWAGPERPQFEPERWSDVPGERSTIPGRSDFAQMVALRVDTSALGQPSTVFGLVGPWGSGKTTLLHETVSHLASWKIVWFSPWSAGDVASLTREFVAALSEAFDSPKLKTSLARYSRFGSPLLRLIPFAGQAIASVADVAAEELSKQSAWNTEFRKLSEAIGAQGKRVLVIVDDVDRLDEVELQSLLRVVRLLGRFTNVHYLMAYDQETIDDILALSRVTGKSSGFMEKIVQYPFELPPTAMVVRRRWARKILDAIDPGFATANAAYLDQREELIGTLALALHTPRAFERLREQMDSHSALIAAAEIDAMDITALTWLRIAHHAVWDDIRLNADIYLSWREGDTDEIRSSRLRVIDGLVQSGRSTPVREVVSYLFEPDGIAGALSGRRWRLRTARYFARYFQVALAEDDVSERFIEHAVVQIVGGATGAEAAQLRSVLLDSDGERSALALDFSRRLRREMSEVSIEMLDFVVEVHATILGMPGAHPARVSAVDQWLAREIFVTFKEGLLTSRDIASRFGYEELVRGAYAMNRLRLHEDGDLKLLYGRVARDWVGEVSSQPVAAIVARHDLATMARFCIWTEQVEDCRRFLANAVADGEDLLAIATKFVVYSAWHGSETRYDVEFRTDEFKFAMGDTLNSELLTAVPTAVSVPDYEVTDLPGRTLSDLQLRDFAIKHLSKLES